MQAVSQLSGEERALAMQRFQLLEPHLAGQKGLQTISESAGVSVRTLQRWVVGYKQAGLGGLFKAGYSFRIHRKDLPGKPDRVSRPSEGDRRSRLFLAPVSSLPRRPLTRYRQDYWRPKLERNVELAAAETQLREQVGMC